MARRFFYIAAGMLMLALAYQFGASTAGAQALQFRVLDPTLMYIETAGQVYYWDGSGTWRTPSGTLPPVPTSTLVAGHQPYMASDGTLWYVGPNGWTGAPLPGGPIPTLRSTWGQVKARYHATPAATPGMTVTPGADNR